MAKIIMHHEMFNVRRGPFKMSVQYDSFHYMNYVLDDYMSQFVNMFKYIGPTFQSHEITYLI
jgi:hypothetical protein